jgi:hypothetical protein
LIARRSPTVGEKPKMGQSVRVATLGREAFADLVSPTLETVSA